MEKKRIGIYLVEYNGNEIGYMRIEIYGGRCLRTQFVPGYSSYVYSVIGRSGYYSSVPDYFDTILMDEYEEYTL